MQQTAKHLDISTETLQTWVRLVTDPFYCTVCGFAAGTNSKLKKHEKSHSAVSGIGSEAYFEKKFACQNCDVRCETEKGLKKHVYKYHREIKSNKRYSDDFIKIVVACALETSALHAAGIHDVNLTTLNDWIEKFKNPDPQQCIICGKESVNILALKRHIRKWHTGTGPVDHLVATEELKKDVVEFAKHNSIEETTARFNVEMTVVAKWIQIANTELICEFCCELFHTQGDLDKHMFTTHESKEGDEAKKQKTKGNSDGRQIELKALYEAKYGRLEQKDIPPIKSNKRGPKKKSKMEVEEEISGVNDDVKEEVPSDDDEVSFEEEVNEDESDDFSSIQSGGYSDDDELFPENERKQEQHIEETAILKEELVEDISRFVKQEMVEMDTSTSKKPIESILLSDEVPRFKCVPEKGENGYQCDQCPKAYPYKPSLWNHKKLKHSAEGEEVSRSWQCDLCPKIYSTRPGLGTHKKHDHEGVKYFCDQCGKQFSRKTHLDGHKQSIHDMKKFICVECGKVFNKQRTLDTHIRAVHEGLMFNCDQCDKQFAERGNLTVHFKSIHQGEMFPCDLCNKSFTRTGDLNRHTKTVHKEGRPLSRAQLENS